MFLHACIGTDWNGICDAASITHEVKELNSFFDTCSKDGHYLLLHCLLRKRFYHIGNGGTNSVSFLADLIKNMKPK